MCGIVGVAYFDTERQVIEKDLRSMADRIIHRGPDDHGYLVRRNFGIGMRRLSIIDLAGGHQPVVSSDEQSAIVFNGELYNYREQTQALTQRGYALRTQSDTEVALGLYEVFGEDFLERLNGMFGFALLDSRSNSLRLVRDRVGIKPLYYFQDDEKIVFASEVKAILAYPGIRAELDESILPIYFRHGFVPAPKTLFKNIYKLPPGHQLIVASGRVKISPYWQISFANKHDLDEAQTLAQLEKLLSSAVEMQMVADVPLGAFLSGGLDSSGIVHLMHELRPDEQTRTYSVGFDKSYGLHDESVRAARFARDYRTDHHAILATTEVAALFPRLVQMLDEPLADSSFVLTYLVSELAAESVKVILSGVGGDEIFSGYRRYLFARLDQLAKHMPRFLRARVLPSLARLLPADRSSPLLNVSRLAKGYLENLAVEPNVRYAQQMAVLNEGLLAECLPDLRGTEDPLDQRVRACDTDDPLDRAMCFDFLGSLPEQLLMLTDKMTMATSIEARVPYLDHRLVEFMAQTPSSMRLKGLTLRHLQRQYLAKRLPGYVLQQKKRGFGAPFGAWAREGLNELTADYLSADRLKRQGLINPAVAGHALKLHMAREEDHSDFLLANLTFQLWYEAYIQ